MKRGFNTFRQEGATAFLEITNIVGEVIAEAQIDAADLPRLQSLGRRWSINGRGYASFKRKSDGKVVLLHRFLIDAPDGRVVDHINRNRLDNRRDNLRVTSQQENSRNRRVNARSTTGIRGVRYAPANRRRPYRVALGDGGKDVNIACATLNIAAITVVLARVERWGVEAV